MCRPGSARTIAHMTTTIRAGATTRWMVIAYGVVCYLAFLASFGVCAFANGMAKLTDKPAQLFQIPGMMLLVPGTFGFLAVSALARGEIEGAARAVEVLLVAGGLVIGVIGANAVVPPRKIL